MSSKTLTLLTWNLAARKSQLHNQLEYINKLCPDIVTLQEVTQGTLTPLLEGLSNQGYTGLLDSFRLASDMSLLVGPRRYGQIIACRGHLVPLDPHQFEIPWAERVLSSIAEIDELSIEVHTTHVPPGSSNGWIKIESFEGIHKRLAVHSATPRILTGDFNSPDKEYSDGRSVVFGEREKKDGSISFTRKGDFEPGRWSRGERSVLFGLQEFDLYDAFLKLHGYSKIEASWFLPQNRNVGRRFDHIFASNHLTPIRCEYLHDGRSAGLSDHSPHYVMFEVEAAPIVAMPKIDSDSIQFQFDFIVGQKGPPSAIADEKSFELAMETIYRVRQGDGKRDEAIAAAIYWTGLSEAEVVKAYKKCFPTLP